MSLTPGLGKRGRFAKVSKALIMDHVFYTLQNFMTHTESVTYLLVAATLVGMTLFWLFLASGKNED